MSLDYQKLKAKNEEEGSFWTSYSDLFMVLSVVFLLLYVVASLRSGTSSVQSQIENQKIKSENKDLKKQIQAYNALKDDYLEKEASQEEARMYEELMGKLSLLQDEAREEKRQLEAQADENDSKARALNQYQQMVRNIVNTNLLSNKKIKFRNDVIKEKNEDITVKKQIIADSQLKISEQENELEKKKKFMLEHINESKFRHQKNYEDEMKKEKEAFERTKRERVENATRAIMNMLGADVELVKQEDQLWRKRISETLEAVINGVSPEKQKEVEQILDMNPEDKKKIGPVIRKFALRFGVPAAVATVVMTDVGNFRSFLVNQVGDILTQQESASQLYADKQKTEWREKNTFNPTTTLGYKESYTDNVIFTTDFDAVYAQEDFQNDWILKVHEFLVKELELSEDVAMDFISAEGSLISELGKLKKDLHPKILDQGIKKMRDHEAAQLAWIGDKIPDESRRVKLAGFRREFFDKYYNEKYLPGRSMAGQPLNQVQVR
jgi:hypothetical protein